MDDAELKTLVDEIIAGYPESAIAADVKNGLVRLLGQVETEEQRRDIVSALRDLEGVRQVVDELSVELVAPEGSHLTLHPQRPAEMEEEGSDVTYEGTEYDFNDATGTTDVMESSSEAEPFFPPTDTVLRPAGQAKQGYEVVGGFSPTSMEDEAGSEAPFSSVVRGDEEIADDVRRELAEDALTTDLDIRVTVRNGIVYLRGRVASLEDVEAVEEVSARVPGVVDVHEELDIAA